MRVQSWIGRKALAAVAVAVALVAAAAPIPAHATTSRLENHHDGDRHHHSPHHSGGQPNTIYYIYPYNPYWYGWTYRYAPAPTYWYYCRSYGAYYPYVDRCPESWVPVPAS